ncbi:hypothetical protein [Peristeroidobacter soli]|uniref:hypothetical protein n=1 Tax=Peristeroidobacter soli TaxID=2497877 RepID=UPI00101C7492|nr:hypothetical protein [Peristeroidobacter soli]
MRDDHVAALRISRGDSELFQTMLAMQAAERVADQRLSDPKKRLNFIAGVAKRLQEKTQQNQSVPSPKLRNRRDERSR